MLHSLSDVESRLENNFYSDYPDTGFLLGRRGVALRVMRTNLSNSSEGTQFVKKVDERKFQEIKTLLLANDGAGSHGLGHKTKVDPAWQLPICDTFI
jgi:hypothetical protein